MDLIFSLSLTLFLSLPQESSTGNVLKIEYKPSSARSDSFRCFVTDGALEGPEVGGSSSAQPPVPPRGKIAPPPNHKHCGMKPMTRIVGGAFAEEDEYPWMAAMVISKPICCRVKA